MPELDRFEKSFTAGYRAAYNLARGQVASDHEISDRLMKALAQDLRRSGGIPPLLEMGQVVANDCRTSLAESFDALDRIVRDNDGHRHTKVAANAGKSILVLASRGTTVDHSSNHDLMFSISTLEAILKHRFFGNACQFLVEEGKQPDHRAAHIWQHRRIKALNEPALKKIATQLVEDPSAEYLRAPRRTVPKESTSTLLHEGLGSVAISDEGISQPMSDGGEHDQSQGTGGSLLVTGGGATALHQPPDVALLGVDEQPPAVTRSRSHGLASLVDDGTTQSTGIESPVRQQGLGLRRDAGLARHQTASQPTAADIDQDWQLGAEAAPASTVWLADPVPAPMTTEDVVPEAEAGWQAPPEDACTPKAKDLAQAKRRDAQLGPWGLDTEDEA